MQSVLTNHMIELLEKHIAIDGGVRMLQNMSAALTRGYAVNKQGQRIGCILGKDWEVACFKESIAYIKTRNEEELKKQKKQ